MAKTSDPNYFICDETGRPYNIALLHRKGGRDLCPEAFLAEGGTEDERHAGVLASIDEQRRAADLKFELMVIDEDERYELAVLKAEREAANSVGEVARDEAGKDKAKVKAADEAEKTSLDDIGKKEATVKEEANAKRAAASAPKAATEGKAA